MLTEHHISYIRKDLHHRGIILEGFDDELLDHICSSIEENMQNGARFIDAYHSALVSFGHTTGLHYTQKEILQVKNKNIRLMLRNYLAIALRNLSKHKFYAIINVIGLALGIAACLLIVLFVLNELSYDRHHTNASRIYRIHGEIKYGENHWNLAVAPAPMASALQREFPEVEAVTRFRSNGSFLVKASDAKESIKENNVIWADSTFFTLFTVPVLHGNPATALKDPDAIAISRKIADKYFPGENALDKTLIINNNEPRKVTAVFEDMPSNSHFIFDILVPMSDLEEAQSNNFLSNNFQTYLLLKEGTDPATLENKFPYFITKYVGPQAAEVLGGEFTMEKFTAAGNKIEYTLMPLTDIHLHSDLTAELRPNGSVAYVYLFSAISFFVLMIACINFMNLSTARSSSRAKEVGVRKVMGSLRSHLVRQFLLESVLLTIFSFIVGVSIATIALPFFNELSHKTLTLPLGEPSFYLLLTGAAVIVGLLAGFYPSFFLSAFKPIQVLKGNVSLGLKSGLIRSVLVVFQFVISIFLVIGAITIHRQLGFIQNKKLGFRKDQVIVVHDAYALGDNIKAFKDEVLKNNLFESGTVSGFLPVSHSWRSDQTFWLHGSDPTEENMVGLQTWEVDHDYIQTMGMNIKEGRFFSPQFPSDSTAVVLNETAVKYFNLGDEAIGRKISTFSAGPEDMLDPSLLDHYTVIGVVEDFHFESLRQNITPLGLFLNPSNGFVCFRFAAQHTREVIEVIETTWKEIAAGQPFQYSFLDDSFSAMYESEQRLGKIFTVFTGLAIIIACLGLFALTTFTADQRTKEIGIRKVLGASVSSIVLLLSKEFGKFVLIAFLLASPLAWYAIDWWLKDYAHKVQIGWQIYVMAGVISFLIAWLTMSFQSIKAATSNPVNSLRNE